VLRSASSEDWETTETMYGISRGFVELLHRVNVLYARSRPPEWSSEQPTAGYPLVLDNEATVKAQQLMAECSAWREFYEAPETGTKRTKLSLANQMCATALEMILLMDLLFYPPGHDEVQLRQRLIYHIVDELREAAGRILGVRWPVVIAASCAISAEDRANAKAVIEAVRDTSFMDLGTAWVAIEKVWRRRDAGEIWCSWRSVVGEDGGLVLI
jgi:hypothetical protein